MSVCEDSKPKLKVVFRTHSKILVERCQYCESHFEWVFRGVVRSRGNAESGTLRCSTSWLIAPESSWPKKAPMPRRKKNRLMAINLKGVFLCSKAAISQMARTDGG